MKRLLLTAALLVTLLFLITVIFTSCGSTDDTSTTTAKTTTAEVTTAVSPDLSERPDGSADNDHRDDDNDGLCDICMTSVVTVFDLYALNDLHGKLADGDTHPGVDELTTFLKGCLSTDDHALFLASGDMWQGSSESNLTGGFIVTEWMNEMNFVSMTLGNHEYDWGEDAIEDNAALAEFPFLAINIYDKTTNKRVDYCEASVMIEIDGIKIGIIGAIGDCYSSIASDKVEDVIFLTGASLTSLVKAESDRLRAEGADLIVYSLHDGFSSSSSGVSSIASGQLSSYYDITLSQYGYVDVVFEGHSHQSYVLIDPYGVYHLQNGGDNKGISHVEINLNFANGNTSVNTAEFLPTSCYSSLDDDPIVEELLEKYADEIAKGARVAGMNDAYRSGNFLRQLVADLYVQAGVSIWGEAYDIVLGGGYVSVRSPGYLAAGEVSYSDLQTLFPFDNSLVLCSIKGSDLKSRFINNTSYAVGYSDYGLSVKDQIDPNGTYYVIVDSYSSTYTPNRLTEVARFDAEIYARDLLFDYIASGGLGSMSVDYTLTSIETVNTVGMGLADNRTTDETYYVKGRIVSIENTTYGNMYIEDEGGNRLYVYGLYDSSGKRFDAMTNQPQVGDTVVIHGPVQKYVYNSSTKIELYQARLVEIE